MLLQWADFNQQFRAGLNMVMSGIPCEKWRPPCLSRGTHTGRRTLPELRALISSFFLLPSLTLFRKRRRLDHGHWRVWWGRHDLGRLPRVDCAVVPVGEIMFCPWLLLTVVVTFFCHSRSLTRATGRIQGAFCPLFRLHGARKGPTWPPGPSGVCGADSSNEVWMFGNESEAAIVRVMRIREQMRPYHRRKYAVPGPHEQNLNVLLVPTGIYLRSYCATLCATQSAR
eukprot:COSAG05_NODE_4027_length_1712_cov_1.133912_3_plen_227_part_00